ncbi:hypothetical protein CPT03_13840 [Pedobacter ginsengisoli]|uniref:Uncharacterized protein n=1 Tax=Pedobacter ginsengisoli TaxID=363852 RepID=A0A2D1U798_9SPHI|nr:hypothetical protein [Pedobacter ginsengisoli]ATP57476.1 hypothetical protein CPT03_13840 [Pedobacter ginsengisoli]
MEMIKKVAQRRASGTAARTNRKSIKINPKPIGKIQAKKRITQSTETKKKSGVVSKNQLDTPKSIDNIDDVFGQSEEEKEEKLVNLVVKVLVKSTLDELYGKESN